MPEHISTLDAQYAFDIVQTICMQVGPGLPGSPQERQRAGVIQHELEAHLGAANVTVEEFSLAPGASLSAFPLSAVLLLLAVLLNLSIGRLPGVPPWLIAAAALLFSILSPLVLFIEFVLGRELLDPLFPQQQSINVIGRLKKPGATAVKRLLIISGHHDSALENTWLHYLGRGFMLASLVWGLGYLTMLILSLIQLAGVIAGSAGLIHAGTLGGLSSWLLLVFPLAPAIIFAAFFNMGRKSGGTVPGAVDNLAACAITVAMCRFLVNNSAYIPADIEIRFISFGSEEAGLRGSRRYVERHLEELKRLDVRLLNFEMVAYAEITILAKDANGTVQHAIEMVNSAAAAAERAGVPYKVGSSSFGTNTDAVSFSQAGLKATSLLPFKMPEQLVAFYHQQWDSPEVLALEPLLNVLKLTFEWICCSGECTNMEAT